VEHRCQDFPGHGFRHSDKSAIGKPWLSETEFQVRSSSVTRRISPAASVESMGCATRKGFPERQGWPKGR